jgi:cyanophycin synthetase
MDRGTWLGHVIEHVAIELQCLASMEVGFGTTRDTDSKGIYEIIFRYRDEEAGLEAGKQALSIVQAIAEGKQVDIPSIVQQLKEIRENNMLGPSTKSIVDEAKKRGIHIIRLNSQSYVQLGHGVNQRRIQATMTDRTTAIGVEIVDDKMRTKRILKDSGVPVPEGDDVLELNDALDLAKELGYPVVVKPLIGNHGRGITVDVKNKEALAVAFDQAKKFRKRIIIEKFLEGSDHRVLIIDGKFVAAARRDPASVTGDGKSTIQELIDKVNEDPRRGYGHENILTKVNIDFMTKRLLNQKGLELSHVLGVGELLILKSTANLSMGGTATDVTDEVHPSVRAMAERISREIDLDVMGIDILAPHLREPLEETGGAVVEVNAAPGFRMHLQPYSGTPRNIAKPVVDMLFPPGSHGSIPIIAVTGTNGKTTTVRLISHILKYSGKSVGMTSTDGVMIGNNMILNGDYSGPEGTNFVLKEPTVDHAVLEVARGSIIRRGLAFDECDVGVLLNIANDHIGCDGINSHEDLAEVKSVVVENVRPEGHAVLNAQDPMVVSCMENISSKCILFSLDPKLDILDSHLEKGGIIITVEEGTIVIYEKSLKFPVVDVANIPLTLDGKAQFNVANTLAAAGACYALGIEVANIERGLQTFNPSINQSPGRMNVFEISDFKVIIDFGHNSPAVTALSDVFQHLSTGKVINMGSGTGNRPEKDILEFGRTLGSIYDKIVITDSDPRNRPLGETAEILKKGILEIGFPPENMTINLDPRKATIEALDLAKTGDLVVLQADNFGEVLEDVMEYKNKFENRL